MVLKTITILFFTTVTLFGYIGNGFGKNREEAIYRALSDIASQISISVNSTTKINKRILNSDYKRDVQNMIYIEIPKISFQNYKVLEQRKNQNGYYIKLEIDPNRLLSIQVHKLENRLKELSQRLSSYSSKLRQYRVLKRVNIKELFLSLELIESINPKFNTNIYKRKIEELNRKKSNYIKELTFSVLSNNQQIKSIIDDILNQKGLIGSDNGNIIVNIHIDRIEKSKIASQYIGTTRATIDILENQQRVFSREFKLTATSLISNYYLQEQIIKSLQNRVNNFFKEILE